MKKGQSIASSTHPRCVNVIGLGAEERTLVYRKCFCSSARVNVVGMYWSAGDAQSGSGAIGAGNIAHFLPSARTRSGVWSGRGR